MNVNHDYKAIWWLPQRTASRSVSNIPAYYNFFCIPENAYLREAYTHGIGIPPGCEDYLIICNVRNPFAHVVSQWHWRCFSQDPNSPDPIISCSFQDYVKQVNGMSELATIFQQARKPDIYFRIENYMEDLAKIPFVDLTDPKLTGLIDFELKNNRYTDEGKFMLQRNPHEYRLTDWRSYYQTEEELDIVRKSYKIIFDECGYDPYDV
jgi:hypothetical protein